jgi:hypothetical protein
MRPSVVHAYSYARPGQTPLCKREIRSARPIVDAVPVASVLFTITRFRSAARSFRPARCENRNALQASPQSVDRMQTELRDESGANDERWKAVKWRKEPRPQPFTSALLPSYFDKLIETFTSRFTRFLRYGLCSFMMVLTLHRYYKAFKFFLKVKINDALAFWVFFFFTIAYENDSV